MTKTEAVAARRGRAHQVYKVDGKRVPGVTTILSVLAKPALYVWNNQMGLRGIDTSAYVDSLARIGTLAHEMIQEYLDGPEWDRDAYSPEEIDTAENAVISFYEWERQSGSQMETKAIELQLVSATYRFGGTCDWYGLIGDRYWLVDIKTCKGLYPEHTYQLAAYHQLLIENGYPVDGVRILRVGRTEDEGFDDSVIAGDTLTKAWDVFKKALELYRAQQDYGKHERQVA